MSCKKLLLSKKQNDTINVVIQQLRFFAKQNQIEIQQQFDDILKSKKNKSTNQNANIFIFVNISNSRRIVNNNFNEKSNFDNAIKIVNYFLKINKKINEFRNVDYRFVEHKKSIETKIYIIYFKTIKITF